MRLSELIQQIAQILFEADPMGLAQAGCPPDEYESEACNVAFTLVHDALNESSVTEVSLREMIYDEFVRSWVPATLAGLPADSCYVKAAQRIKALWETNRPIDDDLGTEGD